MRGQGGGAGSGNVKPWNNFCATRAKGQAVNVKSGGRRRKRNEGVKPWNNYCRRPGRRRQATRDCETGTPLVKAVERVWLLVKRRRKMR